MLKSSIFVIWFMPIAIAGRDLASASFLTFSQKSNFSRLLASRGAGGGPGQRLSSPLPFKVICIKTYRSLAKMGLVLERGAHFQKGNVSFLFENRCPPPLGPPRPFLGPQRKMQPTVVISDRSASLFGQNGPGAREGCTFSKCVFR